MPSIQEPVPSPLKPECVCDVWPFEAVEESNDWIVGSGLVSELEAAVLEKELLLFGCDVAERLLVVAGLDGVTIMVVTPVDLDVMTATETEVMTSVTVNAAICA